MRSNSVLPRAIATGILLVFTATVAYSDTKQQLECVNPDLKKWMDSRVVGIGIQQCLQPGIDDSVKTLCGAVTTKRLNHKSAKLLEAIQSPKVVLIAKSKKHDSEVEVFHHHQVSAPSKIDKKLSYTHFLRYRVDSAVIMQLNRAKYGDWFVTDPLSGCDIWIVKTNKKSEPIIIHANANLDELETISTSVNDKRAIQHNYKSELFESFLEHLKDIEKIDSKDVFVYRIQHYNEISPEDAKHKRAFVFNNTGYGLFYGTVCRYKSDSSKAKKIKTTIITSWVFVLKDGGHPNEILLQIECPLSTSEIECKISGSGLGEKQREPSKAHNSNKPSYKNEL